MSDDDAYESFSTTTTTANNKLNEKNHCNQSLEDDSEIIKTSTIASKRKYAKKRTAYYSGRRKRNSSKNIATSVVVEEEEEEEETEEEKEYFNEDERYGNENNNDKQIGKDQQQSIDDDQTEDDDNNDDNNEADDDNDDDGPKRKRQRKYPLNNQPKHRKQQTSTATTTIKSNNSKITTITAATTKNNYKDNNNNKGKTTLELEEDEEALEESKEKEQVTESDDAQQQKQLLRQNQPSSSNKSQDNMEVRFLVSSRDAGAIIGRGGSNITHLRQTYESSVTVPDCLSPERVLTIVANVEKVTKIIREILKFIDTTVTTGNDSNRSTSKFSGKGRKSVVAEQRGSRDSISNSNGLSEIRLLLHTSHAGGLIGKGGARITQLREETKAGIKVYSECCPQSTERVCAITGPIDIVTNAMAVILNLLRTFPIKGPNQLYNPSNFDPFMSLRYGGYGETVPPPASQVLPPPQEANRNIFTPPPIPPPPPSQYHHPTPPIHHHPFSAPNRHLSALNGPPAPPPAASLMHPDARTPPEFASPTSFMSPWPSAAPSGNHRLAAASFARGAAVAAAAAAVAAASQSNPADMFGSGDDPYRWITDPKHFDASRLHNSLMKRDDVSIITNPNGTAISTIKVNHKIVGAIIGRGGNRIKDIRIKTQADISIDQMKNSSSGGGANMRSITVKGHYRDVEAAVYMICKCIDENRNI